MSRLSMKPRRPKRPKLPAKFTLMECVKWVMRAKNCDEAEAKRFLEEAINSGKLPFEATRFAPGEPDTHGMWRFRDGRIVPEH